MILRAVHEEMKEESAPTLKNVKSYIKNFYQPEYEVESKGFKRLFSGALESLCAEGLAYKPTAQRVKLTAPAEKGLKAEDEGGRKKKKKETYEEVDDGEVGDFEEVEEVEEEEMEEEEEEEVQKVTLTSAKKTSKMVGTAKTPSTTKAPKKTAKRSRR